MELPYDWGGIVSMGRNWLRRKLHVEKWLGNIWKHKEFEVYCTESCVCVYELTGIQIRKAMGDQPLVSPVHAEKLVKSGMFSPVANFGLMERLK
jgi:hypothetical protein